LEVLEIVESDRQSISDATDASEIRNPYTVQADCPFTLGYFLKVALYQTLTIPTRVLIMAYARNPSVDPSQVV